jgi:hypothetical protein
MGFRALKKRSRLLPGQRYTEPPHPVHCLCGQAPLAGHRGARPEPPFLKQEAFELAPFFGRQPARVPRARFDRGAAEAMAAHHLADCVSAAAWDELQLRNERCAEAMLSGQMRELRAIRKWSTGRGAAR